MGPNSGTPLGRQVLYAGLAAVLAGGLTYLATGFMPKVYESRAMLLFPSSQSTSSILGLAVGQAGAQGSDAAAFPGPLGPSTPVVGSSPLTAMGILRSRSCRKAVVEKLGLAREWSLPNDRAEQKMAELASVRQEDTGMVVLSVQGESPENAQKIAEAMIAHLESEGVLLTLNLGVRNRKVLEEKVREAKAAVDEAEGGLTLTLAKHPYTDTAALQTLYSDAVRLLTEARAARDAGKARVLEVDRLLSSALSKADGADALQSLGGQDGVSESLGALATELTKRRLALQDAQQVFTEKSPEFKMAFDQAKSVGRVVDRTILQLREGVKKRQFGPLVQAQADLAALDGSVATYESAIREFESMLKRSPRDAAAVQRAKMSFEGSIRIYEGLRISLLQAKIAEERDPARFEVVDPPSRDSQPVAPRRGLITGGVVALALAGGAWWVLRGRIRYVD